MMNLLVQALTVSAGSWSASNMNTMASTGAFIQQPQYLNTASTGAFVSQPYKSYGSLNKPQYLDTSSTGAFVTSQPYKSYGSLNKPQYLDTASTGAFVSQPYKSYGYKTPQSFDTGSMGTMISQPYKSVGGSYGYGAMESGSSTNPFNANMLNSQGLAPMTVQASKVMPVKRLMGGEQHVVNNDLQMHVNHEADKTVTVKRVVHHSPVLHKTIRTHQIAQDVVHDKKVHHMNVVEDRVKQVPGQQFAGSQEAVDHTVAQPNIASTGAFVQQPMPLAYKSGYKKW